MLRPEPGNGATIERLHAAGLATLTLPLFDVVPLAWTRPDRSDFDGLLLTSANAVRHGGQMLESVSELPVFAVGGATAAAARAAGLNVQQVGPGDLVGLLAGVDPSARLIWLCGEDRTATDHPAIALAVPVYRAVARALTPAQAESLDGGVALVHSARAARQLAAEIDRHRIARARIAIAAISPKAADAAGGGWARVEVAASPDDTALIDLAHRLAIDP